MLAELKVLVKGTRSIAEERKAAMPFIEHDSNLTAAPAEKMRKLSGVLRRVKRGKAGQVIHVNFWNVGPKF